MAIALSPGAIWVGWEPVTGAGSYRVERRTASGDYAVIAEAAEPALLDTDLSAGTRYGYRIRALVGSEPGAGVEGETTTPTGTPGPEQAARALVEAATIEQAMQATVAALSAAGVTVAEGDRVVAAAQVPAASWTVGVAVAAHLAREGAEREVSGRLTADELARMWADGGFPFQGLGTPGEQLMGFLQTWAEEATAAPDEPSSFVPLFLTAMAARQAPPVALGAGSAAPQDLRLTLLELEVLHATFDRSVQLLPEGNLRARGAAATAVPDCGVLKKGLAGKLGGKGVKWVQGQLTDAALRKLGLSDSEMALLGSTVGNVFKALDFAMKIANLIQLYANTQVTLSVGPPDPVHKPIKSDPRRLIEVTARAGIPDEAWARFIDSGSAAPSYRNAMACLQFLGAPLPSDAKDIADKVDTWRVAWDLTSGSPRHALIPTDVNTFDASSNGDPYGMKLRRDGAATAKALLKVDITRESQWATLFDGPERQVDVTVRAKVFTDSPPSPALVLKLLSFVGTVSALVDIGAEWFKRVFPPAATIPIHVRYREPPAALDASIDLSIHYLFGGAGTPETSYDVTVGGHWSARLDYHEESIGSIKDVEFYAGEGGFTFGGLTVVVPGQETSGCEWRWTPVAGQLTGLVAPAQSVDRTLRPELPGELRLGFTSPAVAPHENVVVLCPNVPPAPLQGFTLAYGGIQTHFDGAPPLTPAGKIPGMPIDQWVQTSDGAVERTYSGPRTVSWAVPPSPVLSESTVFRLKPIFKAAQP